MNAVLNYPSARLGMSSFVAAIGVTAVALQVGTGGYQTADYYKQRGLRGYPFVAYNSNSSYDEVARVRTAAEDLLHIRDILKPSVTDLAQALGVSRQAIYDWQGGKTISVENAARLAELARAADVFTEEGLTVSVQLLRRPITSGKRLFDIVGEGGSAEQAVRKLIRLVRRELSQRQMVAEHLAPRKRSVVPVDNYGTPMLDEQG